MEFTGCTSPAFSYVGLFFMIDLDKLKISGSGRKILYYSYKELYNPEI